jgi:hypothetical protein
MTPFIWSRPFIVTHTIDKKAHPIFRAGEKLHCTTTTCGTYRIVRQETSKMLYLYRGHTLLRQGSSVRELKSSI